ncbi:NAD(P)H-dependent oxidoreductase [Gorillibacterium massiliense]|uniref:NAD(P)H-dependent oxidoreductase n=1 Tax=Gorillibacterium massiliense TaxID=1280390 RepID=UPI0004B32C6F|nr:NAD(P)H-dependent oxidoreductase [Gorillibacterium massiliense]
MKTLIVYTHPNHQSLNDGFLQAVIRGCQENARIEDIEVLDLYEEKFDPALVFNEEKLRRNMHVDPELAKYREQIMRADKLVFIYPIWWGRPPAMLLGYIDRVFVSGFAYREGEGLLKGKTVVCVSSMKGPSLYPLLWLNNAHKILMRRALFRFVGIRKVKFFEFGSMESPKGKQENKLNKVYRYFQSVAR